MARQLSELKNDIMFGSHSPQEWLMLDSEVDAAIRESTDDEVQEFVDSGAGEELYMICSAIRNIEEKNNNGNHQP